MPSFRWCPYLELRHAIAQGPMPGDDVKALCGTELTVIGSPWPWPDRCWPTCEQCSRLWRAQEKREGVTGNGLYRPLSR